MALPKQKQSKARGRKRRTNWILSTPAASKCAECGSRKRPHRVCPVCGTYRGKKVISGSV